jgi:mRNA interferase HigB
MVDRVHVVKQSTLKSFAEQKKFATAKGELELWFQVAAKATWKNLLDVQLDYSKAEAVRVRNDNYTLFNICGNKFRLVVLIAYEKGRIFVKDFLTHRDYSSNNWKKILEKAQIARENILKPKRLT